MSAIHVYLRALSYFWHERGRILWLLTLIAAGTACGLLQVWPMVVLVDHVLSATPTSSWISRVFLERLPAGQVGQIVALAVATLVLRLGQDVLGRARGLLNLRIGFSGLLRVRCDFYQKLQSLSLGYHRSQPQGDSIYRLSTDTWGCQGVLNVTIELAVALVMLTIMVGILMSRNVVLSLMALSVAPLLIAANIWFGRMLKRRTTEAKEVDSRFTTNVQRSLTSISLMQAFGREREEYAEFHDTVRSTITAWLRLHWQELCYGISVGAIFGLGGAMVFGYGGYLVYRDQFLAPKPGGMTVGDLMLFLTYLSMVYDPLCKLTGAGASLQNGLASAQRVFEVLDEEPQVCDHPRAMSLSCQPRTLGFENVCFEYRPQQPVLKHVSLQVRPGEMVAFVGSSGVGKSSLLNLLPRFYDPTAGRLTLDGHDLRDIKLRDLRKHIALVLQENILLPASIAENIAYGRPQASLAEIRAAAELAGAAEFIERMPHNYLTKIAEGGANLSGGQRQRIAIARALLTQAPLLVFDEPTSALDTQHEQWVANTLRELKRHRTIVLVSHRLTTVMDCDQIFVMNDGRVVEHGTHDELVALGGHYYEMARHQLQLDPPTIKLAAAG